MSESKMFHIGDVLSVSTGLVVSPRGMNGVYDILSFMTKDPGISTIGLAAVADSCKEAIHIQYPLLANIITPNFNTAVFKEKAISDWVESMALSFGTELEIRPLDNPAPGGFGRDIAYYYNLRGQ